MSLALITSLVGIALFDSVNPSLFLAQFYLIATPKPVPRLVSYFAGVLLVNFVGGLLFLGGAQALIANFLQHLGGHVLYGVQLVLGLALLLFGLWLKSEAGADPVVKTPRSLHPGHTFLLGMAVMLNELTTALPYFIAVERISWAQLSLPGDLFALLLYNLVFALPLVGFLLLFMVYRQRSAEQLERLSRKVRVWTPRVVKYGSVAFGAVLVVNGAAFLLAGVALF